LSFGAKHETPAKADVGAVPADELRRIERCVDIDQRRAGRAHGDATEAEAACLVVIAVKRARSRGELDNVVGVTGPGVSRHERGPADIPIIDGDTTVPGTH